MQTSATIELQKAGTCTPCCISAVFQHVFQQRLLCALPAGVQAVDRWLHATCHQPALHSLWQRHGCKVRCISAVSAVAMQRHQTLRYKQPQTRCVLLLAVASRPSAAAHSFFVAAYAAEFDFFAWQQQ
jgi:hypothetical protein